MSRKNTNQPEYGTELKLAAVRRVLAGESVCAVAQELGIRRKLPVLPDPVLPPLSLHARLFCLRPTRAVDAVSRIYARKRKSDSRWWSC